MLQISPLRDDTQKHFIKLFTDYYKELGCEENCAHLIDEYIIPDLLSGLLSIDILKDGESFAGFVIYQIDRAENDWNFKEGWGDVREIYVVPESRRQGLGRFMLYTAEMKLKESGAEKCYCLPDENAEKFFSACGYSAGNEFSEELDCFVWEKHGLNNGCCK